MKWFKVGLNKPEPFEPVLCYTPVIDRFYQSKKDIWAGIGNGMLVG